MPPLTDLTLRRKISLDLGGRRFVLVKKPGESIEHVLGKAAAAHLYRDVYPDLAIEVPVGDTYKPDVVALDGTLRLDDCERQRVAANDPPLP